MVRFRVNPQPGIHPSPGLTLTPSRTPHLTMYQPKDSSGLFRVNPNPQPHGALVGLPQLVSLLLYNKIKMDGAMQETQNRRSKLTNPYSASDHVPT